jgi:hypothetical protein
MSVLLVEYREVKRVNHKDRAYSSASFYAEGNRTLGQMITQAEKVCKSLHNGVDLMNSIKEGDFLFIE